MEKQKKTRKKMENVGFVIPYYPGDDEREVEVDLFSYMRGYMDAVYVAGEGEHDSIENAINQRDTLLCLWEKESGRIPPFLPKDK